MYHASIVQNARVFKRKLKNSYFGESHFSQVIHHQLADYVGGGVNDVSNQLFF